MAQRLLYLEVEGFIIDGVSEPFQGRVDLSAATHVIIKARNVN